VNKRRAQEYRKLRAEELRRLAQILYEEGLVRDVGPLQSAAGMCAVSCVRDKVEYWEYDLIDLRFYDTDEDSLRHVRPEGVVEIWLELAVTLRGFCLEENSLEDPFKHLNVDILTKGKESSGKELTCSWHLDKHKRDKGDKPSALAHPEYHFQHGGRKVWALNDYGLNLLLETPRLPHPPMDAILAVDFVLSNYVGKKWAILHSENSAYRDLVKSAQDRCWTPYALSTATICKLITEHSPWNAKLLWPQLIFVPPSAKALQQKALEKLAQARDLYLVSDPSGNYRQGFDSLIDQLSH
jgi:hypothetical protein